MKKIKKIHVEVIPHNQQRYETVGDYWFDKGGTLQVRVSRLPDDRFSLLVIIHELIEVFLTEKDGITEPLIKRFDINFEKRRVLGNLDEPGDAPDAPYKKQHCLATGIERIMTALLGVDWREYEKACNEAA